MPQLALKHELNCILQGENAFAQIRDWTCQKRPVGKLGPGPFFSY